MATPQRLDNVHVDTLTARVFTPPANCITNASIVNNAGIEASKIQRHECADAELFATTNLVSDAHRVLHVVRGTTGTIVGFEVVHYATAATTAAFVVVDLQKATNATTWTSVLASPVTISSSDAAYTPRAATISAAGMEDGDIFRVSVLTSGTSTNMPRGLTCHLTYSETYN